MMQEPNSLLRFHTESALLTWNRRYCSVLRRAGGLAFLVAGMMACDGAGAGSGGGGTGGDGGGATTSAASAVSIKVVYLDGARNPNSTSDPIFLIVGVEIDNQSSEEIPLGYAPFRIQTSDSLLIDASESSTSLNDYCPDTFSLAPGGQKVCAVRFLIPQDSRATVVSYETGTGLKASTELPKTEICDKYCQDLVAVQCSIKQSFNSCMSECEKLIPCMTEYVAWITCMTGNAAWECVNSAAYYADPMCWDLADVYFACD
jgi:Domain of unknown function (DUF4352)